MFFVGSCLLHRHHNRHLVSCLWPKRRSPNSLNFASFRAQLGSNSSSDAEPHIEAQSKPFGKIPHTKYDVIDVASQSHQGVTVTSCFFFCIECSMHPNVPWILSKQCSATCASRNSFHSKAWGSIVENSLDLMTSSR